MAAGMGIFTLVMLGAAAAYAQAPDATQAPPTPPPTPNGYSVSESIDAGGHMVGLSGSGAMYNTMVNMQSGPRILGETFTMRALTDNKHPLFDDLTAISNGWGGDPNNFATLSFSKGKVYEFNGTFRRDRQYFDYDLLGNPNVPGGQTLPIGPAAAPTGSFAWPQQRVSPFLYNTVRRMTDTDLTLRPLSRITYRVGYAQNTFEGPSLSPSGYQFASSYSVVLQDYQRLSTDHYFGGIDWKPVQSTKLTFEEDVDHFKGDSFFTINPASLLVQEPDGTRVQILSNYYNLTPTVTCNANSTGTAPTLSGSPSGVPIINPACYVITSYMRSQPTRILFPTEIFRLQSTSVKNLSMNGDLRYTDAKMDLPNYYEDFRGLSKNSRELTYRAKASAHRKVVAGDYGVVWQATRKIAIEDQFTFSHIQQPGSATMTSLTTISTPTTVGNQTVNYAGPFTTTTAAAGASGGISGSSVIGTALPGFFGQKFVINNFTASWDATARATFSLTYHHQTHYITTGEGNSDGTIDDQTFTINQDGGIFNAALRPSEKWNVNGSIEMLYGDNAFTPMTPRQTRQYRVHTLYRPKAWATISGAFNDVEHHNNTNNAQADVAAGQMAYAGPLKHVDYSRVVSAGAELFPNEHYGLDFSYTYSDVYMADNICYLGGSAAGIPAASTPSGTACPALAPTRSGTYDFGPTLDFMHAPTQSASAALNLSPAKTVKSNIGYNINSVSGSRFYNDPRDVAGSLVSTYQSPFVNFAWTSRPGLTWKAEYNFYGYGEGGPSGAPLCSTSDPTAKNPVVTPVACTSLPYQTGLTISPAGETAPRNYHANMVTLGVHYEF